jgi:hypothetical protein
MRRTRRNGAAAVMRPRGSARRGPWAGTVPAITLARALRTEGSDSHYMETDR